MKNYPFFPAILIVFLLLSNQIQCQWNDWSDPIELTSSNSNNENAKVGYLRFTENDFYVFWERWIDSSSTDVVYKKFYDSDEVMILQSESNVHFKNPHHIHAYNSSQIDTNFIVLYEEDSKGYTDIAYQVYTSEGFTNPEYLTSSNNPKTGLKASYSGDVVWMEENKVMFMRYYRNNYEFSDPFVLDSGNCSYPTVIQSGESWFWGGYPEAAWLKHVNDSTFVFFKYQDYYGEWQETDTVFKGKQCANLSFAGGFGYAEMLSWDYFNGTSWEIKIYHPYEEGFVEMEFTQDQPFTPFVFSGDIPVKGSFYDGIAYQTFVARSGDQSHILTSPLFYASPYIEDYDTISQNENSVRKPIIYMGKSEPGCKQYFSNVWEEKVGVYWQLKYAEAFTCLSDVEEVAVSEINLVIRPNPVKTTASISFVLESDAQVNIAVYDATGRQIEVLENGHLPSGKHQINWNGSGYQGGLYFVFLQINSKAYSHKLILSE